MLTKPGNEHWRERLLAYDAEIAITEAPAARARLHHAAGRLLEERLERLREALARYRQANVEDPAYRPALRDARRLYRASGQHLMVAEVLSREAECASDKGERSSLLWDRGQALEDGEADERDVRAAYEGALHADPSNLPALHSLSMVLRRAGDWTSLSGALRQAATAIRNETVRAGILCDLARLCELRLGDVEAACTFYGEAAESDPTHLVALVELERLARRLGRHHLLAKTLEWTAELSAVGPDAAHDWEEVARIRFHCLDDEVGAVDAVRRALAADEDHVPSFDRAEELLSERGAWEELSELYGRRARATAGAEQRAAVLCQQAEVLDSQLGRSEEAAEAYAAAAGACATYLPALRALGGRLEAAGDWEGLVRLYRTEAAAQTDPAVKGERLLRAAEILDRKMGDADGAIEVLREAVQGSPGRLAAVRQLVGLLGRAGLWLETAAVLRDEARRAPDEDQRVEHLKRLADVRENQLDDPEGAAEALGGVLLVRPGDSETRWNLVRLSREIGRWEEIVRLREAEAELLDDPRAVVAALYDVGEIREVRMGDPEGAEATYRAALRIHPGFGPALRALGRILQADKRWEELVEMYERNLEVIDEPDRRAEALLRLADVLWRQMGLEKRAEEAYCEVARLRPGNQAALSALEALYRSWGDADLLAEVLEERALAADSPRDRARLLCALAEVLEDEGAAESQVLDAWSRAVAQDPTCIPALRALSRLHEESGRWDEMAEVLELESDAGGDAVRRLLRSLRLASIRRDRLGDGAGALEVYRSAIATDPGHVPSLQAMESALRELGAATPASRAEVLETLTEVMDDPLKAAASRVELARLLERAGDIEGALLRYAEALRLDPGNVAALEALEQAHRGAGDWGALARLYDAARGSIVDPDLQVDLALRTARALFRAGKPNASREVLEQTAASRQGDPVLLAELVEARERDGDRMSALDAAEALARLRRSKGRAVDELIACGDAWRDQENSPTRALRLYQDAFLLDPSHVGSVERLEAMLRASGETDRLIAALEGGREGTNEPAVRAAIGRRLAQILREQGRLDEAREALSRALREASDDVEALQAQAEVLQELGHDVEAAQSWERLARHARSEEDLREAWLSVARLCARRSDQSERAQVALTFILERWPADPEGLELLQGWHESAGELEGAVEAAERRVAITHGRRERVERLLDVARLHQERDDMDGEEDALTRAREADQASAAPVARLGDLLRVRHDLEGLKTLYREFSEGLSETEEARAIPFLLELGELGRETGDLEAAIGDYGEVLRLSADHEGARGALAELYGRTPDGAERAVSQHRRLLEIDPFRTESYVALVGLFERMRDYERAFLAAGILEYLGALTSETQALLVDLRGRVPAAPRGRLHHDERIRFLRHAEEGDEVRIWLGALAPVAGRLATATPKELGARRSGRLAAGAEDPLRTLVDRLSGLVDADDVETFRVPEGERIAVAVPGAPASMLISDLALGGAELAARRFQLARTLALTAEGSLVEDRGADWTAAALAVMSDEAGVRGDLDVAVSDEVRKDAATVVRKVGIKRLRKYAGEQSDRVRRCVPMERIVTQLNATLRTADRVGILAAADASAALEAIGGPFPSSYDTEARVAALKDRPAVTDALAFMLSEEHVALRHRVHLGLM